MSKRGSRPTPRLSSSDFGTEEYDCGDRGHGCQITGKVVAAPKGGEWVATTGGEAVRRESPATGRV